MSAKYFHSQHFYKLKSFTVIVNRRPVRDDKYFQVGFYVCASIFVTGPVDRGWELYGPIMLTDSFSANYIKFINRQIMYLAIKRPFREAHVNTL